MKRYNKNVAYAKSIKIMDIIKYYNIPLRKGDVMSCLWHDDSHPSAKIFTDKNEGYCFACDKGNFTGEDIVMLKENVDYMDAVKFVNEKFGDAKNLFDAKQIEVDYDLYFMINKELRAMIKRGADAKIVGKYGAMMDLWSRKNNEKMLFNLFNVLIRRLHKASEKKSK